MERNILFDRQLSSLQQLQWAAWNVCPLPAHTLEDTYSTRRLHRQWRSEASDPCRAKRPSKRFFSSSAAATDTLVAGCRPISCNRPDLEEWKRVLTAQEITVLRGECAGELSCWNMKKSPDTLPLTGNSSLLRQEHVAVIAAVDLHPPDRQRWGPWGQALRCRQTS